MNLSEVQKKTIIFLDEKRVSNDGTQCTARNTALQHGVKRCIFADGYFIFFYRTSRREILK